MTQPTSPPVQILLVDDQPANLLALEAVLADLGHELLKAGSGEEALRRLLHDDFALVLLDVRMSGMDGFETARAMRGRERSRRTPIIFITAEEGRDFPAEEGYALGAVDFIIKPVRPPVLRAKVAMFVEMFRKDRQIGELLERRRVEETLRRSESRKAAILESALDAIITIDHTGRVVDFNPAAERTFGYARADAVGKDLAGLIVPPALRADHYRGLARCVASGEGALLGRRIEMPALRADGTEILVELAITRIVGEPPLFTAYLRDLTAAKEAERKLAERIRLTEYGAAVGVALTRAGSLSEELQHCMEATVRCLGAAFARIWTVNEAGDVLELRASAGMYTHLDGPHGRVPVGQLKIGLIARERKPHLTNAVVGDPRVGDQEWARREGMVAFAGYPLVVEDRLVGVIALFARHALTDVTLQALASVADQIAVAIDRKRAEEAERRQREWLHVTLRSVGDAVIATDSQGRVAFLNQVAESLTGWRQEDAVGRELEEVFRILNEKTRQPVETPVRKVIEQGVVAGLANHTILVSRNGTEIPIADSAAPIRGDTGAIQGVVLVFRDVSQARQAERERERLYRESLEARTRAEAGEARLAEEGRRKDHFLALLGHELRNPLAPIRNAASILGFAGNDPEALLQAREMIDRQVTHLTRLVDELLDASRIANRKIQLRREPLDLGQVVRVAVGDHRHDMEASGLMVTVDAPSAPVWVDGDAVRLTQVISNLLHNATKFTNRGGSVAVRVAPDAAAGIVAVSVRDTGMGIEPATLDHLFEPFSQADRSLDRSRGGLGLGLALVRGLVRLHGGEVRAASAGLGKGAEFSFTLPMTSAPAAEKPAEVGARPAAGLRILIVEDNQDSADSLRMVLELAGGHTVAVAHSGTEGVGLARTFRPDIVLCDLGLPGMSGFEVARTLRADPATASARLIAVSGYGSDEDRRQARQAGFDHALVKPVELSALQRLFGQVLSDNRSLAPEGRR